MAVVESNVPLPEIKPTRQWDAWTRKEEENFFSALRQVGKNFEKITRRVQSKNKDQVRHYYYRVIKRMNRILDPSLILDAKNPTYVNCAMLRWWSLLEKHSCSASKLRLKPRRFKAFVTTLEHQLLKDLNKAHTKKPMPAGTAARKSMVHAVANAAAATRLPDLVDSRSVLADDLPNAPCVVADLRGAAKGEVVYNGSRNCMSISRGEMKRPLKPRKKSIEGNLSKAAYAKWEKAASVRVSLMAEAAEQLERTPAASPVLPASGTSDIHNTRTSGSNPVNVDVQTGGIPLCTESPEAGGLGSTPELCDQVKGKSWASDSTEGNTCSLRCNPEGVKTDTESARLRLQLFPFSDLIRKALEQDGHNPHLELTFKARKSISSVLHHLKQKWGSSTIATGELHLFPFSTEWSSVAATQSWSFEDFNVSAADIHSALGNPAVFRLRYAWLSTRVHQSSSAVLKEDQVQSFKTDREMEPVLLEAGSYPQQTSVLPNEMTFQQTFVQASTIPSAENCRASEQPELSILPVGHGMEDAIQTGKVAVCPRSPVADYMAVLSRETTQIPAVHALQPKCLQSSSDKSTSGNRSPSGSVKLMRDKDPTFLDEGPFPDSMADMAKKSTENENANQVSVCSWLYESNDGFAQQLWKYEDSLRSSTGAIAQMDWMDSLTNLSVTELLGEGSRAMLDCPQHYSGKTRLTSLDSFDIALRGHDAPRSGSMLNPTVLTSSTMWGGDETCDAFSFQQGLYCKEVIMSPRDEATAICLGIDIPLADHQNLTCLRVVESSLLLQLRT